MIICGCTVVFHVKLTNRSPQFWACHTADAVYTLGFESQLIRKPLWACRGLLRCDLLTRVCLCLCVTCRGSLVFIWYQMAPADPIAARSKPLDLLIWCALKTSYNAVKY